MLTDWTNCVDAPLRWFSLREPLLYVLFTPWLLSSLVGLLVFSLLFLLPLPLRSWSRCLVLIVAVILANGLFSPFSTQWVSSWLSSQLPEPIVRIVDAPLPVAVLVGRGPEIAKFTSRQAASLLKSQKVAAVYVSGDDSSTAQNVVNVVGSADLVAGDSCARTTWENALFTASWLKSHHPGAPVLLITDPWQLPRAAHAFAHQGLSVIPFAAPVQLSSHDRNRLALREAAGTLLYRFLGRM